MTADAILRLSPCAGNMVDITPPPLALSDGWLKQKASVPSLLLDSLPARPDWLQAAFSTQSRVTESIYVSAAGNVAS